jgi:hypothetical protein
MIRVEAEQEVVADFTNAEFINTIIKAIRDSMKSDLKHLGVEVTKSPEDDDKRLDL